MVTAVKERDDLELEFITLTPAPVQVDLGLGPSRGADIAKLLLLM